MWLEREDQLAGLSPSLRAAAATAAAHGRLGAWAIANTRSSVEPFLASSTRRELRQQVFRAFVSRGDRGDEHDHRARISEILSLRARRARLLGHETHAHWRVEDSMARTPERALALMMAVWGPAVTRARAELAEMQALADAEGAGHAIAAWDTRFYAERVKRARYQLDTDELTPSLSLDRLRDALLFVAGEWFDLDLARVASAPGFHPDVTVFEATRRRAGEHVGRWYSDPFARTGKPSGAWMTSYRAQERFVREVTPLVSNNASFTRGAPGEPTLVGWDDARTLFHELGHALHGLLSRVRDPTVS